MGASLSDQDRDYVHAIVQAAAEKILGLSKDFTVEKIQAHTKTCPHFIRSKGIVLGMLLASTLAGGGGAIVLVKAIAGWLGG